MDLFQYVYLTQAKTLHKWQTHCPVRKRPIVTTEVVVTLTTSCHASTPRERGSAPRRHTDWSLHCLISKVLNSDDKYRCCGDGWSNEKVYINLRETFSLFMLLNKAKRLVVLLCLFAYPFALKNVWPSDSFSPHLARTRHPSMFQM
jgi:hypothetical protein